MSLTRAAQFDVQGVTVHLRPSDSGQTHVLTVRTLAGPLVDGLRRAYPNPTTALQAYTGLCHLFAAGWTLAAVTDFANTINPDTTDQPEVLPPLCEQAA